MKMINIDGILRILLMTGVAGFIYILYLTLYGGKDGAEMAAALAPLGILLSAFIASASVMKSIESTRQQHSIQLIQSKKAELIYIKSSLIRLNAIFSIFLQDISDSKFDTYSNGEFISIRSELIKHIEKLDSKEFFILLSEDDVQNTLLIIGYTNAAIYTLNQIVGGGGRYSKMMQRTIEGKSDGDGLIDLIKKMSGTVDSHLNTI